MVLLEDFATTEFGSEISSSKKRRLRRKKSLHARINGINSIVLKTEIITKHLGTSCVTYEEVTASHEVQTSHKEEDSINLKVDKPTNSTMSSKEIPQKSRDEVKAAREAKKLAKQKAKSGGDNTQKMEDIKEQTPTKKCIKENVEVKQPENKTGPATKGKDEVDKAIIIQQDSLKSDVTEKSKDEIKAERATKKLAKQAKKKGATESSAEEHNETAVTNKAVAETLSNIAGVVKEVQEITAKPEEKETSSEAGKSKAEMKAERRAKQEAQRAVKLAQSKPKEAAPFTKGVPAAVTVKDKEKSPRPKPLEKASTRAQLSRTVNWFQHLHKDGDVDPLTKIPLNSNIHPAIIKLGVQLASRVVTGSNARCIALLNALKKMISDYTLPAKTEFARGLEAHLTANTRYLCSMRHPAASQTNAVKYLRHHLTRLPHNIAEFDAKKILQEEIDRYEREQIDMAGEAISIAVRHKISSGDHILTYGFSSLIERIMIEAWRSGLRFKAVVVGTRTNPAAKEMLRRLIAAEVPATYVDITALSFLMNSIDKVLLGAGSLLVNGSVLAAVGTAQVALLAREFNVPVLVCCETHKFSEQVQTDAFVFNELGNPDDLIDKSDGAPLKDWRSNPNITPLNLTYDVTPASLVTAVVTELAILPCTSAPVVLRFKLSEYGI